MIPLPATVSYSNSYATTHFTMTTKSVYIMKASVLYGIFFLLPSTMGHMELSWPYPIRSIYNPANDYTDIDYSMTSPLEADGSNFPCKGYQNGRPIQTTVTYAAGSTYNISLAGSATHGGGSCQLSLSYDNGATFRVIKSMIGGCPLTSTYDFTIPSYAPTGNALLAWTWQNYEGNREFYMNCAEVNVITGMSQRRKRQVYSSFDSLPYIWKANLDGVNDCATTEDENPVYANPGPDVVYGDGMSSSSLPSSGECDTPTPYGQTYKAMEDSSASDTPSDPPPALPNVTSSASTSADVQPTVTANVGETTPTATYGQSSVDPHANNRGASVLEVSYLQSITTTTYLPSTTTVTFTDADADCPTAVTITITPTPSSDMATVTITNPRSTTAASSSISTTLQSSSITSTVTTYNTVTVVPIPATTSAGSQASTSQAATATYSQPPYATPDLAAHLPCVPGTFICTSNTTWETCDYASDGSASWVYDYPRNVSAGMECLPYLSPYTNDTSQYAQQAMAPNGYYRDDRVVRARPDGDCDDEGSIMCTDGGQQFDVCDQGGWVEMGAVANGTMCVGSGHIVASS